jgi:CheY-like chemotaxis protein
VDGVLRVLLAIDAGESAQALSEQLEREGCSVSMVATGAQVLATAVDPYDLIFIDLELPDAESLTVLHLMRADERLATTPVVLIRGEGEPDDLIQQGLDLGASGYLVKQRLRSHLIRGGLIEMFLGTAPYDSERRQVPRSPMARPDACPYSARGDFHACAAFVPHEIKLGLNGGAARTSCSHLRVGTAATWRLYPRCALGDAAARQKYHLDLTY